MSSKDDIDILVTKKGEKIPMKMDEIARWSCLIEAVEVIDQRGKQMGLNMEKTGWVKPIAIQKYIDERFDTIEEEIAKDRQSYRVDI